MDAAASEGYPRLVGDIGGTRARFASIVAPGAALSDPTAHDCADFDGIESLLRHRLALGNGTRPAASALAVATPLTGDRVRMTNRDWSFSIDSLRAGLGIERLVVVNDFAALALGIETLAAGDVVRLGGGELVARANKAVLGPGTGLGVAGLIDAGGRWRPVAGEGGHVSLAAETDFEDEVLRLLRRRFGRVSAERVLSGPGLVNLYAAVLRIRGAPAETIDAAEITRRALAGADTACVQTVDCFLGWLGAVAGDVALSFGALGGVYLAGGIVPRLRTLLDASSLRARFENKGRYAAYLAAIPIWVIVDAAEAALRGADRALDLAP